MRTLKWLINKAAIEQNQEECDEFCSFEMFISPTAPPAGHAAIEELFSRSFTARVGILRIASATCFVEMINH